MLRAWVRTVNEESLQRDDAISQFVNRHPPAAIWLLLSLNSSPGDGLVPRVPSGRLLARRVSRGFGSVIACKTRAGVDAMKYLDGNPGRDRQRSLPLP
jgi:hypothetical protein